MKHICDGHEYTTIPERDFIAVINNYGRKVGEAYKSECGEYWVFDDYDAEESDLFHENHFPSVPSGYCVEQQLVRYIAANV